MYVKFIVLNFSLDVNGFFIAFFFLIKKIGQCKTTQDVKAFHHYLGERVATSQEEARNSIKELDTGAANIEDKTFDGGCEILLEWFNSLH